MNDFAAEALFSALNENLRRIQQITDNSSDILIQRFQLCGIPAALVCCEGMISAALASDLLIKPLGRLSLPDATAQSLFHHIQEHMLLSPDCSQAVIFRDVLRSLHSGCAVLLTDGMARALIFGIQGYDKRSVNEPSGENNVMGAKDGFIEVIRVNMSLLRRRMKTPFLKMELLTIGDKSQTDICLCYLYDRVPKGLIQDIRQRLTHTDLETVLSTGYLQPFLENRRGNLFDTVSTTQRPDVLAAKLLEGRVAVMIDGTPFVLVVPKLFNENFQTMDDYCCRPYYTTCIRWLKYAAFLIALALPALYVAIALHHPELLNRTLLLLLAEAEKDAPLSLTAEAIGVLLVYEIIREAGLRLPKAVGGAVSIVAGLIIGDAAVSSGLISTPMLTVTAIAVISGFVVPDLNQPITLLRLLLILAGGFGGLFGIGLLSAVILFNLCAGECFGFPAMAPLAPPQKKAMRDILTRVNFRKMQHGEFTVEEYHE